MERDQSLKFINELLSVMAARKASDMFLTVGFPPAIKIDGKVSAMSDHGLTRDQCKELVRALMNDRQAAEFDKTKECNFAITPSGTARYRVNAYTQQGHPGMVLRTISTEIPTLDGFNLPPILKSLALEKRGLVIFVGGTGSGKTTSLAALVNHRNENSHGHIITLEDPIEFVHPHKKCVIMQREIGTDSDSWEIALKNTLRQAPDVILMGEIRDRETMGHAIAFSETGHLCLATLHANSANQAIDRVINFFPQDRHPQLFMDLSLNLRALVSQRLVPAKVGRGRVAAVEVLLNTPLMSDLIYKGEIKEIKELMKKSREYGMQTFDQHLFDLHESNKISYEDACRYADSLNDFRLNIKLNSKVSLEKDLMSGIGHLELMAVKKR